MAQEMERGCGYRKVGGLYLISGGIWAECDRLPFELTICPTCGHGIKFSRGLTEINPLHLFDYHEPCADKYKELCSVCNPKDEPAYLMWVGEGFYPTPEDFVKEGIAMGVSKRLPNDNLPKKLKIGETRIYLAHPKAVAEVPVNSLQLEMEAIAEHAWGQGAQPRLLEAEKKPELRPGIFAAFTPTKIEKLIWEHDATDEALEKLRKRGITPVVIPDGDLDHA